MGRSGSLHLYLFSVPFLGLFPFGLFVFFYSSVLASVFILFYYYPSQLCLLSNERQKGMDPMGGETIIRIGYMRKYFQLMEKKDKERRRKVSVSRPVQRVVVKYLTSEGLVQRTCGRQVRWRRALNVLPL